MVSSWAIGLMRIEPGLDLPPQTGFGYRMGRSRSPDAAWVKRDRLEVLNPDPDKFLPLCPDFVIELRSSSDRLSDVQAKMREYLENGLQLGWLINSQDQQVEVYRSGQAVEMLSSPSELSAEPILTGFVLDLSQIL